MSIELSSKPWKMVKLKDIASQIQYGYTAKAQGTVTGPRFLRITDIQDDAVEWATVPSCDIPAKEKEKYLLHEGDIVFARTGATVGKSYLIRGNVPDAIFASYLIRVRLRRDIEPKYIAYFFKSHSYWRQISESQAGIGQPNVNGSKLADLQIPLAPKEDQENIVAEIEKQFSRLDETVTALKRIQANLKRYKAAVLKAAVEGKLTEQWRKDHPDVEPADQLLKRILAERRAKWEAEELAKMKAKGIKPKDDSWKKKYKEPAGPDTANLPELPEGWVWASIDQLAAPEPNSITDGPFGSNLKTVHYRETGPRVIRLQNIKDGEFSDEYAHITVEHFERLHKHEIHSGDLVIASLGDNPPRACIIPSFVGFAIVKADCIKFKPHSTMIPVYLNAALNCQPTRLRVKNILHGIGRPRLSLGEIREIALPIPPAIEQQSLVAEVEHLLSKTKELEATIESSLKRAERLRMTILQKAFIGDMTNEPK